MDMNYEWKKKALEEFLLWGLFYLRALIYYLKFE